MNNRRKKMNEKINKIAFIEGYMEKRALKTATVLDALKKLIVRAEDVGGQSSKMIADGAADLSSTKWDEAAYRALGSKGKKLRERMPLYGRNLDRKLQNSAYPDYLKNDAYIKTLKKSPSNTKIMPEHVDDLAKTLAPGADADYNKTINSLSSGIAKAILGKPGLS